ncbi:IS701 family transposase [Streptomyces sp. NPDC017056]|uniref:IS701 family transposase n=1 Tax=Streptomyces sp. NPDC017056 TaxID=3364973 RepID=UPI0037B455F7
MPCSLTAVSLPATVPSGTEDAVFADLCARLFASFNRADHHTKGAQYLRGLLAARGRKTIRNVARSLDDPGAAQRLHHFICDAPWNWRPVREALTGYLTDLAAPRAWVVQPMLIPKVGKESVGVHRRFVPELGQMVSGQRASGLWYVGHHGVNAPVDWHLHLQGASETPAVTFPVPRGCPAGLPPVVWDGRAHDAVAVLDTLAPLGLPAMVSLTGAAGVRLPDAAGSAGAGETLAVERLLAPSYASRLTVRQIAPGTRAATARVRLIRRQRASSLPWYDKDLLLYAEWREGHYRPDAYWLVTNPQTPADEIFRLRMHAAQVARDSAGTGARCGLRDFKGRSYEGWHRHMTLASAAYALVKLCGAEAEWKPPAMSG